MGIFIQKLSVPGRKKWQVFAILAMIICSIVLGLALVSIYYGEVSQKSLYMLSYEAEIAEFSEKYDLDPHLVCAMIYCESTFYADAVSSVGAVGLMQIMPSTGRWLAERIGISGYSDSLLRRPSVNLELGCYYVKFLSDRYNGDWRCAVAAYHGGQGRVDKWLADPNISTDGKTLENMPAGETRKYTERVLRVYEVYRKLYWSEFY